MTREEAIKDLQENGVDLGAGDFVDVESLRMAISALREQEEYEILKNSYAQLQDIFDGTYASNMAMGEALRKRRWISVEERLPEDERKVLVYYGFDNDGDGDLGIMFIGTLSYFRFDPDPHWQHASLNLVVTHWMHLPEPPEVEV